jgi:hypothetical protein
MPEQERLYSGHESRHFYKVMVAISLRYGIMHQPTSGSNYPWTGSPKVYRNAKTGEVYTKMSAEEYSDFLRHISAQVRSMRPASERSKPVVILHDRDPSHTSVLVQTFCAENNIVAALLPPRSPDLSPPDYGVFGGVKGQWRKEAHNKQLLSTSHWLEACRLFDALLDSSNYQGAMRALPARLDACIRCNGSHFER